MRKSPEINSNFPDPQRPISFICIKYSDEFKHNIERSICVNDDLNELIVINNDDNLYYATLGEAVCAGMKKAKNELIVIVHEDVLLVENWQSKFEYSLHALELEDPHWFVIGAAGWGANKKFQGHLSDPHSYRDTLNDDSFKEVMRIDEQIFVLKRSSDIFPDKNLPSIHHIGRDLPLQAKSLGLKAYVLNAPTIHKYADINGKLIQSAQDSQKIIDRNSIGFLADRACSDEYILNKWKSLTPNSLKMLEFSPWFNARSPLVEPHLELMNKLHIKIRDSPIIFIAKGGGGSRLLVEMAKDLDLFFGNEVTPSGEEREMVKSIYRCLIRKYCCPSKKQKRNIVPDLKMTAARMLEIAHWPEKWSFKVPESLFLLDELKQAFPHAKYVFLRRDPITTVLRRTHMTARLDNRIGQVTLQLAYKYFLLHLDTIRKEDDLVRMARTTRHQFELVLKFKEKVSKDKWLDLSFEEVINRPEKALELLGDFTELTKRTSKINNIIDRNRALNANVNFSENIVALAREILEPIRTRLNYSNLDIKTKK